MCAFGNKMQIMVIIISSTKTDYYTQNTLNLGGKFYDGKMGL